MVIFFWIGFPVIEMVTGTYLREMRPGIVRTVGRQVENGLQSFIHALSLSSDQVAADGLDNRGTASSTLRAGRGDLNPGLQAGAVRPSLPQPGRAVWDRHAYNSGTGPLSPPTRPVRPLPCRRGCTNCRQYGVPS